ncbi:MAG: aldehyde dehydrogenase [Solirubrobacterales bacterium]|nr:aldehyde dehydrogenase [Solirubrobacterales bacterium]
MNDAHGHLIGGEEVGAGDGARLEVFDADAAAPLATVPDGDGADIDAAVAAARAGQREWWALAPYERERVLRRIGDLIERDRDRLAAIEARNTGKTAANAGLDVDFAVEAFHYYSGYPTRAAGRQIPTPDPALLCYTRLEPVGVVGAIAAWNYPIVLAAVKVAPALAAGCAVVLKPAPETPLTALELGRLAFEAGLPPGCLNVVCGGPDTGAALAGAHGVDKVSFTGSTATGRAVLARLAGSGRAGVLELGGKSPNLVFADADYAGSLDAILMGALVNSGQECCAGARLLVQREIYEDFRELAAARIESLRVGPGTDPASEIGPLISARQRERVSGFVERALGDGARVWARGSAPEGGFYYPPTLLDRIDERMEVWREEVFGPVLCLDSFDGDDEALRKANATRYGLAAGVWTADLGRALRFVNELEAGTVWVNSYLEQTAGAPFGGGKDSGFGRELGEAGALEFSQEKTAYVRGIRPRS